MVRPTRSDLPRHVSWSRIAGSPPWVTGSSRDTQAGGTSRPSARARWRQFPLLAAVEGSGAPWRVGRWVTEDERDTNSVSVVDVEVWHWIGVRSRSNICILVEVLRYAFDDPVVVAQRVISRPVAFASSLKEGVGPPQRNTPP